MKILTTAELDAFFDRLLRDQDPERAADITLRLLAELEGESSELGRHLRRVAEFARFMATKCGMDEREADLVKLVSPMHDIGKWAIPDHILQKPSKLTAEEFEIMKTHAQAGHDLLKASKQAILQAAARVAMEHQEKYDGSGYPRGLKGEEIHIYSRITTVADVFDALASERAYKKAWRMEAIVDYFAAERGRHFDPGLVDLLLADLDAFVAIRENS